MNVSAKPQTITWKKAAIVAVIVLVAGYQWYTENANQIADSNQSATTANHETAKPGEAKRPTEIDSTRNRSSPDSSATTSVNKPFLVSIGGRNLQSPAGLIYGMGGGGEHRVDHVMEHSKDDSSRPAHGVFDGDQDTILKLIDEAYDMIQSNSKYAKSEQSRGNTAYTISMGRKIGYEGGQKGKRNGNRPLRSLRLILDDNRVITAYPYR